MDQADRQCVRRAFGRHGSSSEGRPVIRYGGGGRCIYRHFNPIPRPARKVAKIFPYVGCLILAKGLRAVNGKSVPFAHYRKPTGYPEKTTPPNYGLVRQRRI